MINYVRKNDANEYYTPCMKYGIITVVDKSEFPRSSFMIQNNRRQET